MERRAQGNGHLAIPIPAELDDRRLLSRQPQRGGEPCRAGAGMEHEIAIGRRCVGRCKAGAERARHFRATGCDVDHRHLRARDPRTEISNQKPDETAADHGDAIRRSGCAVPDGIERGLHVGGEHRARRRQVVRDGRHGVGRQRETALVRMQAEHDAVAQRRRPRLHLPDRGVAVLDRERERAAHHRRAHPVVFALGHPPGMDQTLGAAADRAVERAHHDLAGLWRGDGLGTQLRAAGRDVPEGLSLHPAVLTRRRLDWSS